MYIESMEKSNDLHDVSLVSARAVRLRKTVDIGRRRQPIRICTQTDNYYQSQSVTLRHVRS